MKMKNLLVGAFAAAAIAALPVMASAFPTQDLGDVGVGDEGTFTGEFRGDHPVQLFGSYFNLTVDVTAGSNIGMYINSWGSEADTEIALYRVTDTGFELVAINDDQPFDPVQNGGTFDSYTGFGDADLGQPGEGLQGSTIQSGAGFINLTNLTIGRYLAVIAPYSTTWDEFDPEATEVTNFQGREDWVHQFKIFEIPAPASAAMLACGVLALGRRRRD